MRLPQGFLTDAVETWEEREYFKTVRITVRALSVVNDAAERAVKLATDFNEVLTKDEEQRQLLYQVVEYHRKLYGAKASKTDLNNIQQYYCMLINQTDNDF